MLIIIIFFTHAQPRDEKCMSLRAWQEEVAGGGRREEGGGG